ncbi:RNA-dependent RNA polymerase 1 [Hordeum vulgare]|nr:RNA-dependent RNA polymerase 1 [Hordeum vulgare]
MAAAVVLVIHSVSMVLLQIQQRLNDEVWEVRFHFHHRDNLERSLNVDDITFAIIELEGYRMTYFMYYVKDPRVGVSGMEELTHDGKVEEMLNDLAVKGEKVVNITVIRSDAPRPSDLDIGQVCEDQVPLCEIGVPVVYEIDTTRVLFPSPTKTQPMPVQVINRHESSYLKQKCPIVPKFVMDIGEERHEYFWSKTKINNKFSN